MNVYDFDKTIFYPDSSFCFAIWEYKRHPLGFIRYLPLILWQALLFYLKITPRKPFKEALFRIVRCVPDIDADVKEFWDVYEKQVCEWYIKQKRSDDLIISASPEFLVKEMTDRLGVRLIGTIMDKKTGLITGANNNNKEKVRRFSESEYYGHIDEFYSDSLLDTPLAELADRAFLVVDKGQRLTPWD